MHPIFGKEVFKLVTKEYFNILHIFRLLKDKKDNRQKHDEFFVSGKSDTKQKSFREVLDMELEKYK